MKNDFGACGLKLSTEDAAMTIDQIKFWADISLLPVVVKIGGPNARNDIKQLVSLNIDGLIVQLPLPSHIDEIKVIEIITNLIVLVQIPFAVAAARPQ